MQKQHVPSETEDGSSEQIDTHALSNVLQLQSPVIREVWEHNFKEEITILAQLVPQFNIIAIDTQFPGFYAQQQSKQQKYCAYPEWSLVVQNVQKTRLIQVGLTLSDSDGKLPYPISTWQFNFKFDLQRQNYMKNSINMLVKAGIDFNNLKQKGIQHHVFAEAFMSSGLPLNKHIKWIIFHGVWDCTYMLRLLRNQLLPTSAKEFLKSLRLYFPWLMDLKTLLMEQNRNNIGLSCLGQQLGCNRVGSKHQAGSDSLLTINCYFQMIKHTTITNQIIYNHQYFTNYWNIIYGIEYYNKYYNKLQDNNHIVYQQSMHGLPYSNSLISYEGPLYQYLYKQQSYGYNLWPFRKY